MISRVRAQLWRLATQPFVWGVAALLLLAGAWSARWSPALAEISTAERSILPFSLGGAVEVATTQLATGLGVALAALLVAAGPGRDFVDDGAELQRANGSAPLRFVGRALAVSLIMLGCGIGLVLVLFAARAASSARNDLGLEAQAGTWNAARITTGVALALAHVTWVMALAQLLRTQAAQLALPVALVVVMLMVSRLSPWPLTPDSWVGPMLGLRAERATLDYWWSVGGEVLSPTVNVVLLVCIVAFACVGGIASDRRAAASRPRRLSALRAPRRMHGRTFRAHRRSAR